MEIWLKFNDLLLVENHRNFTNDRANPHLRVTKCVCILITIYKINFLIDIEAI